MQRLQPLVGLGLVFRWLAVEPQGGLGLVMAQWWAELGSEVVGCGTRVPESSVSLLVGEAGS